MDLPHNVTAHVFRVFSEQHMLVAMQNDARFNNDADTANASREINFLYIILSRSGIQLNTNPNAIEEESQCTMTTHSSSQFHQLTYTWFSFQLELPLFDHVHAADTAGKEIEIE